MELNQKVYLLQSYKRAQVELGKIVTKETPFFQSALVKAFNEHYATLEINGKHVIVERTEIFNNRGMVVQ